MKSRSRAAVRSFIVRQQAPKGVSEGLMCLFSWGSCPRCRCPGVGHQGGGGGAAPGGAAARRCLRSAAAFLPFSSFKAAPAALAPGSLICRATPLLPPLPQPRRGGGGTGTPGGTSPIPAPNIPEGTRAMGRLLLPLPSWHLLHQRRAAGEGNRVRMNGAVC